MGKKKKQNTHKQTTLTKNAIKNLQGYSNQGMLAYHRSNLIKLGLQNFLQTLGGYFARQIESRQFSVNNADSMAFLSDKMLAHILHIPSYEKLQALIESLDTCSNIESFKLPKICLLDNEILSLAKNGTLRLYDIFQCLQMVKFFYDCIKREDITHKYLIDYFQKFTFPSEILDLLKLFIFDNKEKEASQYTQNYLSEHADTMLTNLYKALENKQREKQEALYQSLNNSNLQEYLIDKQIHLLEDNMALLVRPGYANVLKARVIGRSTNGFFYIVPLSLENIESQIHILHDKIEERLLYLAKEYSKILSRHVNFLRFVHTEFDFMDKALSRLKFAKDYNYSFVFVSDSKMQVVLNEYAHPSLKNPIPISVQMDKNLLMITGVNAGGKTMLLKSILSALWCAKLCIPMRINAYNSKIPYIKDIHIIAQDPQDSHNDISTFSGRIQELSIFIEKKDFILGIDEIEIGTDSSEAASLYKVLLTKFLNNGAKLIVTTHHKHLAALMADNPHTKLLAALYDYENASPMFNFIEGIGKSYAMECAKHYGIPKVLIDEAKRVYGDEANKLERLIEESHAQITRNKQENLRLQRLSQEQEQKIKELDLTKKKLKEAFEQQSLTLKRHYNEAIKEIKMLAKQSTHNLKELNNQEPQGTQEIAKNIHKLLNKAHQNETKSPKIGIKSTQQYKAGDVVQYQNKQATVIKCDKDLYTIECKNGIKIKVQGIELNLSKSKKVYQNETKGYELQADIEAKTTLDLHGYKKEEALEELESFLNDAIIARFSKVRVIHGIGNGILKKAVEEFLTNCKFIYSYDNAPNNTGAKIIYINDKK